VSELSPGLVSAAASSAPCYIYDARAFASRATEVLALVDEYFYPIKANPDPAIVRAAIGAGAGLDVCSSGDLVIALASGVKPAACSFTSAHLHEALARDLLATSVSVDLDSLGQVALWVAVGGRKAGLRVCTANAQSAYGSKFGLTPAGLAEAARVLEAAGGRVSTLHLHDAHADATPEQMADSLSAVLKTVPEGLLASCERVNIGGGWPMPDGMPVPASGLASTFGRLRARLSDLGFRGRLAAEPGEWTVGPSGWLAARVSAVKSHPVLADRLIVVLDTATPVPCRPSRAPFALLRDGAAVSERAQDVVACDVYGSANTGLDTIGVGVSMPPPRVGDTVVSAGQGAYARQLTGSFNERTVPEGVVLR